MRLRQVQCFLMVVETGSFTDAAGELYITQSSVSKQIIALEKELGFALFDRSRRRVALTRAGDAFLPHARKLSAVYLDMLSQMGEHKTTPTFSILSIPVIAQYGIASWVARFRRAHPGLSFTLEEREPMAILRALANQTHDLAFVRDHYLDCERHVSLVVARDRLIVALPSHHPLAGRRSIALAELAAESFVVPSRASLTDQLVLDACHRAGFTPYISYTSLRTESILGQVASGSGIALVMGMLFEHSRHQGVAGVPLEEPITSNVVLAWLRDKRQSRAARAFITFVRESLAV